MEMPEGWKHLQRRWNACPTENRIALGQEEVLEIMSLMREMAEALEWATDLELSVQYESGLITSSFKHKWAQEIPNKAKVALNKFKEWK